MRQATLKQRALKLWADNLKKGNVLRKTKDIPDENVRAYLKREKLLYSITPGFFIFKKPEDDPEQLFMLLYWQIIELLLERYNPWSIRSTSALLLHIGNQEDQKSLLVRTAKKANYQMSLPYGFKLSLVYDSSFDSRTVEDSTIVGRPISIDIPEKVLVDCVSRKTKVDPHYRSFVKGVQFEKRLLEVLYAKNQRPVVFKRITEIAKEVGRSDLAQDLEEIAKTYTHYRVSKRPQTNRPQEKPTQLIMPWIARQEELIDTFEKMLEEALLSDIQKLPTQGLKELVSSAQEHKRYDIYHSTTLEGYRITPEEVDAVVLGIVPANVKDKKKHIKEIEKRMAILGYSEAFDFTIDQIKKTFGKSYVSEQIVKDTHYNLFKPSTDSGIVDYFDLASYRKEGAFIRGTRYVPPGPEKLAELMNRYEASINQVDNSIIKAILAHFFFVTIHPYTDGNGRTARLMMNYLLMTSGYQWITIKAEQRKTYFDALTKGQLHDDIVPFGEFIVGLMKQT